MALRDHFAQVIDFFVGGQKCDENRQERSTEVHMQCCEGTTIPNFITADAYFADQSLARSSAPRPPMPKATLNAIKEPKTCAYRATVCTPLLCKREVVPPVADASPGQALTSVMKALNSTCLMKQEEWWTYELCFAKGIRQLRINNEHSVLPDGTVEQKKVSCPGSRNKKHLTV